MPTGYVHPDYAAAFGDFGEPLSLPKCQGWLLKRTIPGTDHHDAMGCYPLFSCRDWAHLPQDLTDRAADLVSVSLVLDPFGEWELSGLHAFFDRVVRFKEHFVVDLSVPLDSFVPKHHRYYARKALRELKVERCENPSSRVEEWTSLYSILVKRHQLTGIKAFSMQSFARQLAVPGLVMFRALKDDHCLGAHLWYIQGDVAYSHLLALSEAGYAMNASYALYSEALRFFGSSSADHIHWAQIGAGAGSSGTATDGLTQFKRGWSNAMRPTYFCGKVMDSFRYEDLCRLAGVSATAYFPAYREGELG